jgi:hypothetical protein
VWNVHELSSIIVSNWDFQFVSLVWKTVCEALKIDVELSTVFYSDKNDQSKIINQKIKRYLRNCCIHQQDDWFEWLFMIEFLSNAVKSIFIDLFVFLINYEFESRMSFNSFDTDIIDRLSIRERVLIHKAETITNKMRSILDFIRKN